MSDARTKLEVLYLDGLGEINEVINRIEALKSEIPSAADQVCQKIEGHSAAMVKVTDHLGRDLLAAMSYVDKHVLEATKAAVEVARSDIRQVATEAASNAVRIAVGNEIRVMVRSIKEAAEILSKEANQTVTSTKMASRQLSFGLAKLAGIIFASSSLACLFAVLVLHYAPGVLGLGPQLASEQVQLIHKGEAQDRIWSNFAEMERELARALQ